MITHWGKLIGKETVTTLFLIISLLAVNVKFFFLLTVVYIIVLGWKLRSWEKVVIYGTLPISLYNVGQLYVYRLIEPWELNHPLYLDGRSLFFKLTPMVVFSTAIVMSFLVKLLVSRVRSGWTINILLLIVVVNGIRLIGTTSFLPWWANIMNYIVQLGLVVWLWWTGDYLLSTTGKERFEFLDYFGKMIRTVLVITSVLVLAQGLKGTPLGLVVEQSNKFPYFGSGTGELGLVSRPIGISVHANNQAFDLLVKLSAWILIYLYQGGSGWKKQKWLLFPLLAIVWLQSRAVYLGCFVLVAWWWFTYGNWRELLDRGKKVKNWTTVLMVILAMMVLWVRFLGSLPGFGGDSGWKTRAKLVGVTMRLVSHHFWMGVGQDNFIAIAFQEDLTGFMKTFPESVHNGFLLIMAEQGVVGLMLWSVFLVVLMVRCFYLKGKDGWNKKRFWLAAIFSQFLVMSFQPFSNILNWYVMISVLLLDYYDKAKAEET